MEYDRQESARDQPLLLSKVELLQGQNDALVMEKGSLERELAAIRKEC
jgi:hypothetical protein